MQQAGWMLTGLLAVLAAVAAACGQEETAGRTGVPEVDAVVQAVLSGDQQALRGFVRYTPVACSTEPDIGSEPCRPGEPDGTLVEALPAAQCEGYYIRADGIDQALENVLAGKPELYGVYRASPRAWLPGDYTALFSVKGPKPEQIFGMELLIDDGEIVWINFGCAQSPEQLAERLGPTVVP